MRLILNDARFVRFDEVEIERSEATHEDHMVEMVSMYVHRVGVQYWKIAERHFVTQNSFLMSHFYNLALVHLVFGKASSLAKDGALRYNFKKFYAECLLGEKNCLMGRALLIEGLAYEQDIMRPAFAVVEQDVILRDTANAFHQIMSKMLTAHELMHYFLKRFPGREQDLIAMAFTGRLRDRVSQFGCRFPEGLSEELLCDSWALHSVIKEPDSTSQDRLGQLRMVAFGFLCFAELTSLQMSAQATAQQYASEEDERIQLGSHIRPKEAFSYAIGRFTPMDTRVMEMIDILRVEASHEGLVLFGEDGTFPLPADLQSHLLAAFESCAEVTETSPLGLTGTDAKRRQMAQLLAEAFHDHDAGMKHLLWRSKTFNVGGTPVDP